VDTGRSRGIQALATFQCLGGVKAEMSRVSDAGDVVKDAVKFSVRRKGDAASRSALDDDAEQIAHGEGPEVERRLGYGARRALQD
jgi:hypothetical protein